MKKIRYITYALAVMAWVVTGCTQFKDISDKAYVIYLIF